MYIHTRIMYYVYVCIYIYVYSLHTSTSFSINGNNTCKCFGVARDVARHKSSTAASLWCLDAGTGVKNMRPKYINCICMHV